MPSPESNSPLRILLVEDRPEDAELIQRELRKLDRPIEVRVVDDAPGLCRELAAFRPDLVLSDYMLPRFDGMEALRCVQQNAPHLPFIIVTGSMNEMTAVECMKAGAWDYVIKEKLGKLRPAVESALHRRDLERQNRRALDALRASEKRFRTLIANAPSPIVVLSDSAEIIYANLKGAKLAGLREPAGLIGKNALDFFPPEDREAARARFLLAVVGKTEAEPAEWRLVLEDGRMIYAEINAMQVDFDGRPAVMAILNDITRRKHAEAELRKLSMAVEQSPISVVITNAAAEIEYVNPAFTRIAGYSAGEVLGRNPRIFQSGKTPPETYEKLWNTLEAGQVWTGEFINKKKDGTLFWEKAVISPLTDAFGRVTHYLALKEDVTRVHVLEDRIRQAQKMEALGALAGGIAHDLNNILTPILGYADMARAGATPGSELYEELGQVIQASRRARELIEQLLTFSRRSDKKRRPMALQPVVREALKLLRAGIPRTVQIKTHLEADGEWILADPTEIHQTVINLATNAFHAMPDGGTLTVTLRRIELGSNPAENPHDLPPGPYLLLSVKDTGTGIPPEILDRIFEPYFTTKPEGRGTGFGLAQVHAAVTDCGGTIAVSTELGAGSRFDLFFPAVERPHAGSPPAREPETQAGNNERILLVDDDPAVARLGERMLVRLGYRVARFTRPLEALEKFRKDPAAFDLLVSDMTMAPITGLDLARAVLEIRPDLPVIVSTGFSEKLDAEIARQAGIAKIITKPFGIEAMSRAVRELLDKSRSSPPAG